MTSSIPRRNWLLGAAAGTAASVASLASGNEPSPITAPSGSTTNEPSRPEKAHVDWPMWDEHEESVLLEVLNSGKWGRTTGGKKLLEFEAAYGKAMQAKYCLATTSGTTALITALGALNIGPGDEVILPPYTFVATFNVITHNFALPIFVDTDIETFQIDPSKIAPKVNENTKLVLPVHIGGSPADLDGVLQAVSGKSIPVLEDACQAPLAQWRGKPVGTVGIGGCFSFQASKNLTSGEGGAIITNDEAFANQCYNFHTPGGAKAAPSLGRGSNYRLTEFQAGLLVVQLARLEQHARLRDENAAYLTKLLNEIPGISPAKLTPGCTRSAWHLYMFRYDKKQFGGMSRAQFLQELGKRKVGGSGGYTSLNTSKHVKALADNPHYQKLYGKKRMEGWVEENACPVNDRLCEEAVWFSQQTLLGSRDRMEAIAEAIRDVKKGGS